MRQRPAHGEAEVGVILHDRMRLHVRVVRPVAEGVKVAHDEVRLNAARLQRAVAAVGRDHVVSRPGAQAHAVKTGRADDIANVFQIHSSFPEFSSDIVPHSARREKNCM